MERLYSENGGGNNLIPLATFFRKSLETIEFLLIEGASSEPADDAVLIERVQEFLDAAKDTHMKFAMNTSEGKQIILRCEMLVEQDNRP